MQKIFRFYLKNKKICIIGVVAIGVCMTYIMTYYIPDYFNIEAVYSFIYNISISYLAAVIFYIVQVYGPEEANQRKSLEILRPKFEQLIEFIEVTLLVFDEYIDVKQQGAVISWTRDEKIYIKFYKKGQDNKTLKRFTKEELISLNKSVGKLLLEIRNDTVFKYCEYGVAKLLSDIQMCGAMEEISNVIRLSNTIVGLNNVSLSIEKMRVLLKNAKKLYGFNYEYAIDRADVRDITILDMVSDDMAKSLKDIDIINKAIFKENIKEQIKKNEIEEVIPDDVLDQLYKIMANSID